MELLKVHPMFPLVHFLFCGRRFPLDTVHKLIVYKMLRRYPARLVYVQFTFYVQRVGGTKETKKFFHQFLSTLSTLFSTAWPNVILPAFWWERTWSAFPLEVFSSSFYTNLLGFFANDIWEFDCCRTFRISRHILLNILCCFFAF